MIHLRDYKPAEFSISETRLAFDLHEDHVSVRSHLQFRRENSAAKDLELDGVELELIEVSLNGQKLLANQYELSINRLKILNVPDQFELSTLVRIHPETNTSLEGIYRSRGIFTSQCEAQGFRKITYYLDRPDVMSLFTVTIEADEKYKSLLSNGDVIKKQSLGNGRHQATWTDPFKKPCYLFALVAGDFGILEDHFTTKSGKKVLLQIYAEHQQLPRCQYAMESLKHAMKWDEDRFGLEYDLSTYMIVATDDFTAGAMENKGLNVFNSRLIVADPTSATDNNYHSIESVIAHEYFHNWTGNRVTLRDWFHLSLKEGLTVFRDQEFSMDQVSRDLIRIDSVIDLRDSQFPEDQGPNAHPIRPESCHSVDNFFTSTIYEKGAEVIRMMQTMVGRPGFQRGMDLYFKRHDGQAVIIEDFARAISEANNQKWDQFQLWYSQAGTPRVHVQEKFDDKTGEYSATLTQSCPPTPGQPEKKPFHIPLILGLLDRQGAEVPLKDPEITVTTEGRQVLNLKRSSQTISARGLKDRPVLSLNREFSAPIEIDWQRPDEDLLYLFVEDSDAFNRWEAGQKLMLKELRRLIECAEQVLPFVADSQLVSALEQVLKDDKIGHAFKARMVDSPSLIYLTQTTTAFNPATFEMAFHQFDKIYGQKLAPLCLDIYQKLHGKHDNEFDPRARGSRSLKNWALKMLCWEGSGIPLAVTQFSKSKLMTDRESALYLLTQLTQREGDEALQQFYDQWQSEPLVLNKWWTVQASLQRKDTFDRVKKLGEHPAFRIKNPNCVYSLYGVFGNNLTQFHRNQGERYQFFANRILELDQLNPRVAAYLASAFDFCTKVDTTSRARAREVLRKTLDQKLSENCYEIMSKTFAALTPLSQQGSTGHETGMS